MIKKINKTELLRIFLVFFSVLFKYIEMWSYSLSNTFQKSNMLIVAIITLSFIILFEMKVSKKHLKKLIILGICCFIMTFITKSTNFLISYLFTLTFSTIDDGDEKFLKYFLYSSLTLFIITLALNIIGILPNTVIIRNNNGIYIYRNNLGFYGANSLFLCLFPIIVSCITLYYINNKNNIKKMLLFLTILISSYIFYKKTDCRAGMLTIVFVLIICNFNKIYSNKIIKFITKYYFIIFLIISLLLSYRFGTDTTNIVNRLSSGRMYFWNCYINNVGMNLFGNSPIKGWPLDNIYLNSLYIYGIICYVINLFITLLASKNMLKNKKTIFMILAFATYSFFENNVSFSYNFIFTLQMFYIVNSNLKLIRDEDKNERKTNKS